jgi:protein required for attachment to host cells
MSPEVEPKQVEAQRFALSLAGVLKQGLNRHAYEELVLAAPPHFLGLLRQAMDEQVAARVAATFDKNFIALSNREIENRIYTLSR